MDLLWYAWVGGYVELFFEEIFFLALGVTNLSYNSYMPTAHNFLLNTAFPDTGAFIVKEFPCYFTVSFTYIL